MKLPFNDEEQHTLQTKKGSFKSHTYMKLFWPILRENNKSYFCLQKVRRETSKVEFISRKIAELSLATFLKRILLQSSLRISPFILNKTNEISCLCLRDALRKISMIGFVAGTVTDIAVRNFLKKSSTILNSKDISKSFEIK